jgi:endonuclease/exonuclease/phosphatase family metal-dependent hydrolase
MKSISVFTQNTFASLLPGKIKHVLLRQSPDIVCMQEIKGKKIPLLLKRLKYPYIIFSSKTKSVSLIGIQTIIASRYPIVENGEVKFNEKLKKGIMPFQSKALFGVIQIHSKKVVVYSCHINAFGETLNSRRNMLMKTLIHAIEYHLPAIVCGDMNTVIPKKRPYRFLFRIANKIHAPSVWQYGSFARQNEEQYFSQTSHLFNFTDVIGINFPTFRIPGVSIRQKLDWMLYHDIHCSRSELTPWIGDHRGIFGTFMI